MPTVTATVPAQMRWQHVDGGNQIAQLLRAEFSAEVDLRSDESGNGDLVATLPDGSEVVVTNRPRRVNPTTATRDVLFVRCDRLSDSTWPVSEGAPARWLWPQSRFRDDALIEARQLAVIARESWAHVFSIKEEALTHDGASLPGLRPPQVGALHSVVGHWRASEEMVTVVMPTGTGKTEVMLALLAHERLNRLLVVVPTDALRDQLSNKFMTWGWLRHAKLLDAAANYPVVGALKRRLSAVEEVDRFFGSCNVVVSTMSALCGVEPEIQQRIAEQCSHLFIDEAHHTPASTWNDFRDRFAGKPIVQFTATPFRNDGRMVEGKVVFNYPLHRAQRDGYFRPVNFRAVEEYVFAAADEAIARAALEQLSDDLSAGMDHLVMARTSSISRATVVHAVYERLAARYSPLVIHSNLPVERRNAALQALSSRATRVVVCVDMLGEGFDLPELKIAALHDMHKSLTITLQFVGRFTRSQPNLGEATVIANVADANVEESLTALYAENSDWNTLLRVLSEENTQEHIDRSEFIREFDQVPAEISLRNLAPPMSTLVYRTNCTQWQPTTIKKILPAARLFSGPLVNRRRHTMIFVTMDRSEVKWGAPRELLDVAWNLYLVHWSPGQGLIFINSSDSSSNHEWLARAIAGSDADQSHYVELIRGERIFRVLAGINRLTLLNLGLRHVISKAIQFSMHMGADIGTALTQALRENKSKSNLFGKGFERGKKATIGCSLKGRIWSYKIARDLSQWVNWCEHVGTKLLDDGIDTGTLFEHVITPEEVQDRPQLMPITIDWYEDFVERRDELVFVRVHGSEVPLFEIGIELVEPRETGPIRFRVFSDVASSLYAMRFDGNRVVFAPESDGDVTLRVSKRDYTLGEWLSEHPPIVRFEDGSFLQSNELSRVRQGTDRRPYDISAIDAWTWGGVDRRTESQGLDKNPASIQRHVIERLLAPTGDNAFDIVFDDDGAGEIADVVAIRQSNRELVVHLFHCKYMHGEEPGARLADLYEVCGQAQKSVIWKEEVERMFRRMRSRETARTQRAQASRFERGSLSGLATLARKARTLVPVFHIFVVQPGISRTAVSRAQLDLLAVTELYLRETYDIPFGVIGSA